MVIESIMTLPLFSNYTQVNNYPVLSQLPTTTIEIKYPTIEEVKNEIEKQSAESGLNKQIALDIAFCESSFKWDARNPNSSAKGIFQFTDPTWRWIKAKGHQFDYKENIKLFIKYYPIYPGWWEQCN